MATSDVKLLGAWSSPYVNRVMMALKIKSIEYELVETSPYKKSDLLLRYNPVYKKIPVLIHGEKPICESLIIVEYIDDAWTNIGPSILPSDPYDRAIARSWAAYVDDKLFHLLQQLSEAKEDEAKTAAMGKVFEGLILLEEAFINCSKGKAFFGGDNVGYFDIALGCLVGWMRVIEILNGFKILDETKTPRLVGWVERLYSDSCVKDAMLEPEPLLEVINKFKTMSASASD